MTEPFRTFNPFARPELWPPSTSAGNDQPLLEVRVEQPGGPAYRLDCNHGRGEIRATGLVWPRTSTPFDRGLATDSLGPDGRPLPVLLVRQVPLPAGVLVTSRPIGAALHGPSVWLIAVPQADERLWTVGSLDELPSETLAGLRTALASEAAREGLDPAGLRIEGPVQARELAREARRRGRLAHDETARQREGLVAWAPTSLAQQRWIASEAERFSTAEYDILLLPFRFQKYARECLLPDERVLAVAHRPAGRYGRRWPIGEQLHEGVFVLTDQQVAVMEDVLPPGKSLQDWGYRSVATDIRRVASAELQRLSDHLQLEFVLEAAAGREVLRVALPLDAASACATALAQLRRFAPTPGTRALARRFQVAPDDASMPRTEPFLEPSETMRLLETAQAVLPRGHRMLRRAVTPPIEEQRAARVLVLSDTSLFLIESARVIEQIELAEVTSLRLENALFGSRLDLSLPGPAGLRRVSTKFPYQIAEAFVEIYHTARRLLVRPARPPAEGEGCRAVG